MQGSAYECIAYLVEIAEKERYSAEGEKRYEVKAVKPRRSLTQNAYYWVMLNKLARKLQMPDSEVHLNMLREYGVCEVMSLSINVCLGDYFKYYDTLSVDYRDGEERQIVKVYKGSSHMTSSEFTHLIEGMREECELQGIDVLTPEEIAKLEYTN